MEYQVWFCHKPKQKKVFSDWIFMSAYKAQVITGDERGAYHQDQHIDLGYIQARSRVLKELQNVQHGLYDISKDYRFKIKEGNDYFQAASGEGSFTVVDLKIVDLPEQKFGENEYFSV